MPKGDNCNAIKYIQPNVYQIKQTLLQKLNINIDIQTPQILEFSLINDIFVR